MNVRSVTPQPEHVAFRNDVLDLLKKHAGHLDAKDMLALSAHLVGQLVAMQDQRTMTREIALEIVARNIEAGNAEVLANLNRSKGSA